jgi:hypothetical protein
MGDPPHVLFTKNSIIWTIWSYFHEKWFNGGNLAPGLITIEIHQNWILLGSRLCFLLVSIYFQSIVYNNLFILFHILLNQLCDFWAVLVNLAMVSAETSAGNNQGVLISSLPWNRCADGWLQLLILWSPTESMNHDAARSTSSAHSYACWQILFLRSPQKGNFCWFVIIGLNKPQVDSSCCYQMLICIFSVWKIWNTT